MQNSEFKNTILASLSMWHEHHSINLCKKSDNVFVIRDLRSLDFHLISFCNNQFDLDTVIHLNLSVKKTEHCQTNFTIYLTAGVCIAIIDLDSLEILSGEAKGREGIVQASKKADSWIDLIIKIKLDSPSPIYLGCSLNNQPIYEGFEQDQFYIEDSISIDVIPRNLKHYLNYVKHLTKEGKIADAIDFYHSQVEKPLSDQQIYQLIWKDLNELGKIPEDLIEDRKISKEDALIYFEQNSKYKTINLLKLSPKTNQIIEKSGLSREYLKIMLGNNPGLEETYINIVQESSDFKFSKKQARKNNFKWLRLNEDLDFQQSIVETGYIYTLCPFQGKILKSNQSFYIDQSQPYMITYRFQSLETFYLIVGHWGGAKLYLYFPNQELVIYINEAAHELILLGYAIPVINNLKAQFVSHWGLVKQYISSNEPIKKVVAITGNIGNLGHFWWNNLTGLEYLVNNQLLPKLHLILLGLYCHFDVNLVFPEIESSKLLPLKDNSIDLFSFCLENNYIIVYFSNTYITNNISKRVCSASLKQAEPDFLKKVREAKKHFPLLWINLRSHNKTWVSQVPGYVAIITNLAKIYPNLAIVFDGLPVEKEMMVEIQSAIPENITTYSALECKVYESIVWAQAVDAYIAVVGSGLTLVTWIANKPGVVHADSGHMGQMVWWQEVGPDSVLPVSVPKEHIHDLNPGQGYTDYECDWIIIYELLLEILKKIPIRNMAEQPIITTVEQSSICEFNNFISSDDTVYNDSQISNSTSVEKICASNPKLPLWAPGAVGKISTYLASQQTTNILQFGANWSTIWLSNYYPVKLTSVECNHQQFDLIQSELLKKNHIGDISLLLADLPYAKVVEQFPDNHFDLILVEGEDRNACIQKSVKKIKNGGLILLNDAERSLYREGRNLLEIFPTLRYYGLHRCTQIWFVVNNDD